MSMRPILKTYQHTFYGILGVCIVLLFTAGFYILLESKFGTEVKVKYYNNCIDEARGENKEMPVSPELMNACRENTKLFFGH